jgi:hypothetical protein
MDAGAEPTVHDPRDLQGDYSSDLWFPRYRSGAHGPWSVSVLAMHSTRGYWGDYYRIDGTVMLSGPGAGGASTWMSMLPCEMEAQEIGLRAAHGHTVVMGLGMGWVAANVALRPDVRRVTVVERDPDTVALIESLGVFGQLPDDARDKIEVVIADALTWRAREPIDTLQADIWENLIDACKLSDVRRMQENLGAPEIYFWGQETEIWRAACRRAGGAPLLTWPLIRSIVGEDLALPLILPNWVDYPQKIAAGAQRWNPPDDAWWR